MTDRPNIMVIMADQLRWDCLGCMGNPVIKTPNIDALAARGVLFRNAFSPNPICVPARATIMTGNYPHVCTGVKNNGGRIRAGQPLLTEVLKREGYRTYAMGKLHFVPFSPPGQPRLVHGFEHVDFHESGRAIAQFDKTGGTRGIEDYFDYLTDVGWHGYSRAHGIGNNDVRPCPTPLPPEHTVDHWIADCTIRQLDRHFEETPDHPFFMFMSSPKPHSPYDPPQSYAAMYDSRAIPLPFGSVEDLKTRNPQLEQTRYTHAVDTLSPEAWQVIRAYYYGCVSWLDAQIGRVLARLSEKGCMDNTLILFAADHGDLLGDFGTVFKMNHLNGSVRVPFIVAGPGAARGASSAALVGLQDILPTLAGAAGAAVGQAVHGKDLARTLADPSNAVRDIYYSSTGDDPRQSAMVYDGRWKYIYSQAAGGVEELYDQERDPGELHNLAHDPSHREALAGMRARLVKTAIELGDEALFDGDRLKTSDAFSEDPKTHCMVGSMGWRWY